MPEITYLLELTREEAQAILDGFAVLHKWGVHGNTLTRKVMARIVELMGPLLSSPEPERPANFHGPNDPGPESQPDALSPYTASEWKEIS